MKKAPLLLLLIAVLPCCLLRDFTPDNELRYLSIADEALRDGHIFAFYNHGAPYADKPPFFLWGVMFCRWIAGGHYMALLSLLTILPAWGVLRTMDNWLNEYGLSSSERTTAALLLAGCGFFPAMALCIRPDMLMCLFITLALREAWLYIFIDIRSQKHLWLFALWVFMGVFSKGVVGLLMPLITTLVFLGLTHRLRLIPVLWGWRTWLTLLAGCGLWIGLVWNEGGSEYLDNLLIHQTVDRAINAFTHKQPFYYYLTAATYVLAPWTLLVVWRIGYTLKDWKNSDDLHKYFLTAILATTAMLSLSSSKLAVYLLPVIPFCTALAALDLSGRRPATAIRISLGLPAAILSAAFPATVIYVCVTNRLSGLWWGIFAGTLAISLCAIGALICLFRRYEPRKAIRILSGGLYALLFLGGWSLPALNGQIGYGELSRDARTIARETGIDRFGSFRMRRVENIDTYLKQVPREITEEELATDTLHRIIILSPRRKRLSAATLFEGKRIIPSGKYDIIIYE